MEFQPFPKIPRLLRDISITEKIDGTNASVTIVPLILILKNDTPWEDEHTLKITYQDIEYVVYPGSRKRFITPEKDNFGFASWVRDNIEDLISLGEGRHYGEWWGQGIQRKYGVNDKRFSLFNTSLEDIPDCCHLVPTLYEGVFNSQAIDDTFNALKESGSIAAPGFNNPEGIMIYHKAANQYFKRTFEGDEKGKWKI